MNSPVLGLLGLVVALTPPSTPPPRFDFNTYACLPPPALVGGPGWTSSAPRFSLYPGDLVLLGLTKPPHSPVASLEVQVISPRGQVSSSHFVFNGGSFNYLVYPRDFLGGQPTTPGRYTVLWRTPQGIVACDGFQVSPPPPPF